MKIVCGKKLKVKQNGIWWTKKTDMFVMSSPKKNLTDWAKGDFVCRFEDAYLEKTHENDAFILCWIDYKKATRKNNAVRIDAGRFAVNKAAPVDVILKYLNAAVYFPEGALVLSPNLLGNFTSDQFICYNDIDGRILLDNSPHELTGKMPKAVTLKLLELLGLPLHYLTPFRFVTTKCNHIDTKSNRMLAATALIPNS